jgi:hypothetical protein
VNRPAIAAFCQREFSSLGAVWHVEEWLATGMGCPCLLARVAICVAGVSSPTSLSTGFVGVFVKHLGETQPGSLQQDGCLLLLPDVHLFQ